MYDVIKNSKIILAYLTEGHLCHQFHFIQSLTISTLHKDKSGFVCIYKTKMWMNLEYSFMSNCGFKILPM